MLHVLYREPVMFVKLETIRLDRPIRGKKIAVLHAKLRLSRRNKIIAEPLIAPLVLQIVSLAEPLARYTLMLTISYHYTKA